MNRQRIGFILSEKITGGNYKYDDYYSAFGLKNHRKVQMNEQKITAADLSSIENEYSISPDMVKTRQDELLHAFPYKKDE